MKKQSISEIIRQAEAGQEQPTPATVWDRIEASLPAEGRPAAKVRQLNSRRRYLTIAASFLVLAIAGWWALVGAHTSEPQSTVEVLNIEGSLELEPNQQNVFTDAFYGEVIINEGTGGSDRLRACVQC